MYDKLVILSPKLKKVVKPVFKPSFNYRKIIIIFLLLILSPTLSLKLEGKGKEAIFYLSSSNDKIIFEIRFITKHIQKFYTWTLKNDMW
jgi:hypothetical protein